MKFQWYLKKVFYGMHCRLVDILICHDRSILVVEDFLQLHPVLAGLVYASSLNTDHQENYIADELGRMFSFVVLIELM